MCVHVCVCMRVSVCVCVCVRVYVCVTVANFNFMFVIKLVICEDWLFNQPRNLPQKTFRKKKNYTQAWNCTHNKYNSFIRSCNALVHSSLVMLVHLLALWKLATLHRAVTKHKWNTTHSFGTPYLNVRSNAKVNWHVMCLLAFLWCN